MVVTWFNNEYIDRQKFHVEVVNSMFTSTDTEFHYPVIFNARKGTYLCAVYFAAYAFVQIDYTISTHNLRLFLGSKEDRTIVTTWIAQESVSYTGKEVSCCGVVYNDGLNDILADFYSSQGRYYVNNAYFKFVSVKIA